MWQLVGLLGPHEAGSSEQKNNFSLGEGHKPRAEGRPRPAAADFGVQEPTGRLLASDGGSGRAPLRSTQAEAQGQRLNEGAARSLASCSRLSARPCLPLSPST